MGRIKSGIWGNPPALANNITRYIEVSLQYIIAEKSIWWDYGKIPALANYITRYIEVPLQYIIAEKSIWCLRVPRKTKQSEEDFVSFQVHNLCQFFINFQFFII